VLAGFGDDPHRYGDAKASGNTHHQALRVLRNKRTGILRLHWPPPALHEAVAWAHNRRCCLTS